MILRHRKQVLSRIRETRLEQISHSG